MWEGEDDDVVLGQALGPRGLHLPPRQLGQVGVVLAEERAR